jgi:carbon-monoxide dehydrogenase large subunit
VNAIVDALAELGVEHLDMPVTPERVWSVIRAAAAQRGRAASQSWSGGTRAST